jgi:adiponectin receptor
MEIDTVGKCVRALFHIHNETGNIWIHIIGGVIFITLFGIYVSMALNASHNYYHQMGYIVTAIYLLSANVCMSASAIFHLFKAIPNKK